VKADLAGQRGICPDCGARFIVPSFSGERVAEVAGIGPGGAPGGLHDSPFSLGSSIRLESASELTASSASEVVAWYVRPAAGGQFGPATADLFQQWLSEGRVAADSWVWRTGWERWKLAGEVLTVAARGRVAAVNQAPADLAFEPRALNDAVATGIDPLEAQQTEAHRAELRRRRNRARGLSLLLGIVALAMVALLVVALAH
jgi:hypothetical protein